MSNPTQNSSIEYPAWFDGKRINEGIFCTEFLRDYPMLSVNGTFFTVNGRVRDENRLKRSSMTGSSSISPAVLPKR